jgi:hypothetical protein
LRTLVDKTMVAMSAGVAGVVVVAGAPANAEEGGGACELALAVGGVDSRLMPARSGDGGAKDGESTQIGGGGAKDGESA